LSTTRNGVLPDARSLKRRARAPIAALLASVVAIVLLAAFASAASADDADDPPLTAADIARMVPPGSSASAADSTSARPATLPPEMPSRPTFTTPAVPPIDHPGNDDSMVSPPETQEIPQAMPEEAPVAMVPPITIPASADMNNYMKEDPDLAESVGSARDFVAEGEETSSLGFQVRESRCRLKTGEETEGLLILKVAKDSPAARAGLRSYKGGTQHALQALAIGAGIAFPPAMLLTMVALPMIEYTEMGKSYDLIIGVDGSRVTNFLDFEERMRDVQPGELVYFNVVRSGKRIQLAVPIPALSSAASN
jgi:PDZ domain